MTAGLRGEDLRLVYGGRAVVDGVELGISGGEVLGLIGPNGAGKSSLLRLLAGVERPTAGRVLWNGTDLPRLSERERARQIGYLPQAATLHWPLTVRTVVELGRLPWRAGWQPDRDGAAAIRRALTTADLDGFGERRVDTLSGGERMRVMVARLLAGTPQVLLADEPVAGLDLAHQLRVMRLLRAQAREGRAVLVVLHDLNLAARFCDRLLLLADGRVRAEGPPSRVLDADDIGACYGVELRRVESGDDVLLLPVSTTPD
jgi:iron complex transport system ATP-binding protein